MRRNLFLFALAFSFCGQAMAQPAAPAETDQNPYAVPVEVVPLVKFKGKFFETTFAASSYVFATSILVTDTSGPFSIDVLGASRIKKRVTVTYRFTKLDGETIAAGKCQINVKFWSGLWNTAENSVYTCAFNGLPPTSYALEAVVPNIEAENNATISLTTIDPDKYKVLKARMRYGDVLYEAAPTGFEPDHEARHLRVATGYRIYRDGKLVGRIDFPDYKGRIVDINGSYERTTVITAPVSEHDGREAVIFFAAQLLRLPEANSPALEN